MTRAEAPVARHARLVIHQRELLADQAVEQGRLADIGPADDGDGEGHAVLLERDQARVVGQDIDRLVGDNRRQMR